MLSIIALVISGLFFALAGLNQTIFNQPELDEVAWGGFFLVLSMLLGGVGPAAPWRSA